ncbi:hypothetical protein SLA2020_493260 [Shorea laevis]
MLLLMNKKMFPKENGLNEMVGSRILQSMIDHIEEKGIKFDMIHKERVPVPLELWRSVKVAELETLLKEALFHEELFKITYLI